MSFIPDRSGYLFTKSTSTYPDGSSETELSGPMGYVLVTLKPPPDMMQKYSGAAPTGNGQIFIC